MPLESGRQPNQQHGCLLRFWQLQGVIDTTHDVDVYDSGFATSTDGQFALPASACQTFCGVHGISMWLTPR